MIKKVKDITLGIRVAGGVINRRQLITIATGVVRANNPNLLKENFLERKVHFSEKHISIGSWHDISPSLIINIDQTPLSYVNTGKYTFCFKSAKNIPIKGVDDKRQITATFAVSCTEEFLPIQLISAEKAERSLPKYSFPPSFSVTFTEDHWSKTMKFTEFFKEIILSYLKDTKQIKSYPLEQHALIIMDTFKGQDNDTEADIQRCS